MALHYSSIVRHENLGTFFEASVLPGQESRELAISYIEKILKIILAMLASGSYRHGKPLFIT